MGYDASVLQVANIEQAFRCLAEDAEEDRVECVMVVVEAAMRVAARDRPRFRLRTRFAGNDKARQAGVTPCEEGGDVFIRGLEFVSAADELLHTDQRRGAITLECVADEIEQRLAVRADVVIELAGIAEDVARRRRTLPRLDARHDLFAEQLDGCRRSEELQRLELHAIV